jgi:superfamily II DNA or RNA helicase
MCGLIQCPDSLIVADDVHRFLALPISWKGTLQQYVGLLHRLYDRKKTVMVYDYIDSNVPVLMRMYQKRLKGYRAMGYGV